MSSPLHVIDRQLLRRLTDQAAAAPRLRTHFCLHQDNEAPFHRLVVASQPGTRVRAHRHATGEKWELLTALAGRCDVLLFADDGTVEQRWMLSTAPEGTPALELPCDRFHLFVVMEPDSVFMEVKPGPYVKPDGGDWAAWAPEENSPEAVDFETWCRSARIGDRYQPEK